MSWAVSRNHALDTGVEVHWLRNRWTMQSVLPGANRRSVGPDTWGGRINYSDGPIDSRALRLNHERSRQIVAGIEQSIGGGASVRIEGYHRAFDRLLVQQLETDAEPERRLSVYFIPPDMPPDSAILEHRPTTRPESTGTGRAFGLEVLLQRHRGRVTGWVSYAISQSERELYGRTVPSTSIVRTRSAPLSTSS